MLYRIVFALARLAYAIGGAKIAIGCWLGRGCHRVARATIHPVRFAIRDARRMFSRRPKLLTNRRSPA